MHTYVRACVCVGVHVGVYYKGCRVEGVVRQKGNYMQDSASWKGWGKRTEKPVGWACTVAAYCRNVNPPNVLQLEEEQDHRLNWACRAGVGVGGGGLRDKGQK